MDAMVFGLLPQNEIQSEEFVKNFQHFEFAFDARVSFMRDLYAETPTNVSDVIIKKKKFTAKRELPKLKMIKIINQKKRFLY